MEVEAVDGDGEGEDDVDNASNGAGLTLVDGAELTGLMRDADVAAEVVVDGARMRKPESDGLDDGIGGAGSGG